ncbi:hypothetical protein AB0D32_32005 [Micromonospora sp. NPDC048170]|uniref:NACHT domain-containing protein n=1 Tax=Micromonospora sp. NPDC048170 TaxID=3154819 RepID=UPI0033E9242C
MDVDEYENLILLCPVHHTMVDADGGRGYNVETLVKMRRAHERQEQRSEHIERAVRAYVGDQYAADDKVLFEQAELRGPSVDAMFVDVPFGCRLDAAPAELMARIAANYPGDITPIEGYIVTGAAQALLHPEWSGNALLVGGPGAGKSTLLQYICQFHRARLLGRHAYTGGDQRLKPVTDHIRTPIRIDLRRYADWASSKQNPRKVEKAKARRQSPAQRELSSLEEYIAHHIKLHSGGQGFSLEDFSVLVATQPVLLAFDGLDEVANLKDRALVSDAIVSTHDRLSTFAYDLVIVAATRPGATTASLWSSQSFPIFNLQRLTYGLRLQYLQKWSAVARLTDESAKKLQRVFLDNQNVPHIRELASYPMQMAILLHLLHRRQLLPQQRTELYREYLKTFLDREQTEEKEPLLSEQRKVIEDIHAFLGWYLQSRAEEGIGAGSIGRRQIQELVHGHLAGREDGQELAKSLFSAISSRVLCLVERETNQFEFEVQSLREYFAALYIFDNAPPRGRGNSRDDCLDALLERPYWSNVCRFFVGMFSGVEVRGIRHNLRGLSAKPLLRVHPLLRSTATLLLDDRTFQGQPDEPIQEIVDFVLDGPGVVLAEDGLLEASGTPLALTGGAGRKQAVRHLQKRLCEDDPAPLRMVLADSLHRHAQPDDGIAAWWWNLFKPSQSWLETAATLTVLGGLNARQTSNLVEVLPNLDLPTDWISELLVKGGYDGLDESVLRVCIADINDGAAELVRPPEPTTSLGRLLECAIVCSDQRPYESAQQTSGSNGLRTRVRRRSRSSTGADSLALIAELRQSPGSLENYRGWYHRLAKIADFWGDGWVLRQAVGAVPPGVDLSAIATDERTERLLACIVATEDQARARKNDVVWWRQRLRAAKVSVDHSYSIFSLLTVARSNVLIELAGELNTAVDQLKPKYLRLLGKALRTSGRRLGGSALVIQDQLRRNLVNYSPRSLWLLRPVVTDSSIEQIDKKLVAKYGELLEAGAGDMRPLLRIVGAEKTVKIDTLRGTRTIIPTGAWASDVKLGAIATTKATEILRSPSDWPADVVQRAVEHFAERMATVEPISSLAARNNWFQDIE